MCKQLTKETLIFYVFLDQPGTFLEKSQRKFFYRKLCRKIKDDKSIAFRIIAIMLGASSVFGISTSHHERVFVSFCLLWSLILCGAFQGSLYNVYTTPKSYPNIDTLDDLYKSKLDVHVRHPGLLTDIFGDAPFGTTIGNLRTRRLKTTSDDFLNERIVSRGDVAGLTRFSNYDYDNKNLEPREDGASNLHVVAECPRSYTLAFLFRKRSIYINTVNWHINMFLQSGLTVKWQMESKHYFKLEAALKHHYTMMETKVKINLQHLEMAFVGLMLGHINEIYENINKLLIVIVNLDRSTTLVQEQKLLNFRNRFKVSISVYLKHYEPFSFSTIIAKYQVLLNDFLTFKGQKHKQKIEEVLLT
ncbi:CLUMA_CG008909, isoform A [Clunio marinus]|uniref:CLUMA_CG008909, isoform A n=1 Tax=Clunio marinus TaxID=568069 RepID=A0A1J1I6B3_9DIPT|nr:CLUMA_CG008909, isoform A [Clunio marinus]